MSYWRLFYHLVWSTKNREPILTAALEPLAHEFIRVKAIELDALVFALNGTENHVHLVASIPPHTAVMDFIGQVKGASSYKINRTGYNHLGFAWQGEYGVFSFDQKRLPNYVSYVDQQKEHHAMSHLIPILERTDDTPLEIREVTPHYVSEDDDWWRYMCELE